MLPEQVWDYADMPSEGLYFGRSAGSAQPLCWAHAEYLKLLHSVVDGRIFDCIPVVAERYAVPKEQRTFQSRLEIFRTTRPISAMVCGGTLRIVDPEDFTVVWSADNWATTNTTHTKPVDSFGSFADIVVAPEQTGSIVFTLFWPRDNRWLGRNFEVTIHSEQLAQMPASRKPQN
jgi:glucoamylase